ncbi:hypothetical protein ABI428_36045, partial [Pseudomonas aeruginosa]
LARTGYCSFVKARPSHFNQPAGGVAVGHGTGTPTGSAEPSPKPTFISQILPTLSQYFNHSKGSIFNADWLHTCVNK